MWCFSFIIRLVACDCHDTGHLRRLAKVWELSWGQMDYAEWEENSQCPQSPNAKPIRELCQCALEFCLKNKLSRRHSPTTKWDKAITMFRRLAVSIWQYCPLEAIESLCPWDWALGWVSLRVHLSEKKARQTRNTHVPVFFKWQNFAFPYDERKLHCMYQSCFISLHQFTEL